MSMGMLMIPEAFLLTPKMKAFVTEYMVEYNIANAAIAAGYSKKTASQQGAKLLADPRVATVLSKLQYQKELRQIKTADDILKYIQTVMFFVPSRYFSPGGNGGWIIDEENYKSLPDEIGCLIEDIEVREAKYEDGYSKKFWVSFVSKTTAMQLAARYQLGIDLKDKNNKFNQGGEEKVFEWDRLFKRPDKVESKVEEEIRQLEQLALPSPETASKVGTNGSVNGSTNGNGQHS